MQLKVNLSYTSSSANLFSRQDLGFVTSCFISLFFTILTTDGTRCKKELCLFKAHYILKHILLPFNLLELRASILRATWDDHIQYRLLPSFKDSTKNNFWDFSNLGFIRHLVLAEVIQILVMQPLNANVQYAKRAAAIWEWESYSIYALFLLINLARH